MTRQPPPLQAVPISGRDHADRFAVCLDRLLEHEGGFNNIAADRGGATNFGISLRFLRAEAAINADVRRLFPAGPIDIDDIRALTRDQAARIYRWCFWIPAKCDALPAPVDGMVFDQAVNAGIRTAGRLLQRAINASVSPSHPRVIEDGAIGLQTIGAAGRADRAALVQAFRAAAAARYRGIVAANPSQRVFLQGWLNRAAALGDV